MADPAKVPPPEYVQQGPGEPTPSGYGAPPPAGYPPQGAGSGAPPPGYPPQGPGYGAPQASYQPQSQNPPGYGAQQPYTAQPMGYVQTGGTHGRNLGDSPAAMQCPHCQAMITTTIGRKLGLLPWLICLGLFVVGLWLCCFIPLCIPDLYDVIHSCPNCHTQIGIHKKL